MPRYYVTPKHNIPKESPGSRYSDGLHRFAIVECYLKYAAWCIHETIELQGTSSTPLGAEVNGKPHSTAANTRKSEHAGQITTRRAASQLSVGLQLAGHQQCLNS